MKPKGSRLGPDNEPVCTPELTDEEVAAVFGAVVTANTGTDGLTNTQAVVVEAVGRAVTSAPLDPYRCEVVTPDQLSDVVCGTGKDPVLADQVMRYMSLIALLEHPVPAEVVDQVTAYGKAMGIDDASSLLTTPSESSRQAAIYDFARNGYSNEFASGQYHACLHTDAAGVDGWAMAEHDPVLHARWQSLQDCPQGTIGRNVYDFYQSRKFVFPGAPGSTPPLLAQHDWVHVLANFGTTVTSELEVFGLISASDSNRQGFSLLAMVIGLFETGSVDRAAGLFEADPGHLSNRSSAIRLADGLRRGACATRPDGGRDGGLMTTDWFAHAETPMEEMRNLCNLSGKSRRAIEAGSPGTWEVAGLSEYQQAHCDMEVLSRHASEQF